MTQIQRVVIVFFIHLAFYLCFYKTGSFGFLYACISVTFWSVTAIVSEPVFEIAGRILWFFKFLMNLAFFLVVGLAIAATMPQSDGVSPLNKMKSGKYPSFYDVGKGFNRYGLNLRKAHKRASDTFKRATKREEEMRKTIGEMEKQK